MAMVKRTNFDQLFVHKNQTVIEAIKVIDSGCRQIALVVDDDRRLVGILTDGDVRRAILNKVALEAPINKIMKDKFTHLVSPASPSTALSLMTNNSYIHHVPVLDKKGRVEDLFILDELLGDSSIRLPNEAVIMAGGLGKRLHPDTLKKPKPMLEVGGKPILQNIIEGFRDQGIRLITISINYLGDQIKDFFKDGRWLGCEISYIEEPFEMGTFGSLSLFRPRSDTPVLVINGDVLASIDCQALLSFHQVNNAIATVCVKEYLQQVPFGVIKHQDIRFIGSEEKPVLSYQINAGLYVFNPAAFDFLAENQSIDTPTFLNKLNSEGHNVCVFPLMDNWFDVGQHETLKDAREFFDNYN